jgi:hypothetical protein
VDARQLAELVGMAPGALRAALAAPTRLPREQLEVVARALGVERAVLRALARSSLGDAAEPDAGPPRDAVPGTPGAPTAAPHAPPDAAPARSVGELLERVLAAVADGEPWTAAARLAVLDAAEQAAVAAGRGVPRELHALRHRARRDGWPAAVSSAVADIGRRDGARRRAPAPRRARAPTIAPRWTAPRASCASCRPAGAATPTCSRRCTTTRSRGSFAGTPWWCARRRSASVRRRSSHRRLYGRFVCLVADDAAPDARRFAMRVALAHVAAGDVGEDRPLAAPAPDGPRRAASLVALADLVPFMQLATRAARGSAGRRWPSR